MALAACLAALAPAASASSASGAVTIGQLAPDGALSNCTFAPVDRLQPTVTSGTPYVVPSIPPATALVVKSWSYRATGSAAGQMMTMKVFRKVGDPATYQAVGHDGPRPIAGGTLNTFATNVPVSPGDVLGTNQPTSAATTCVFSAPGDSHLFEMSGGDLADGQSTDFQTYLGWRVNISAVVSPSNAFILGKARRKVRRGTAILTAFVPNPGRLTVSGRGLKRTGKTATAPGRVRLLIAARGRKKRQLNKTGRVRVRPKITYTPTGGDPRTRSRRLTLRKR